MKAILCLTLLMSTSALCREGATDTKIVLTVMGVSEPEAIHLLDNYCRNFRIVQKESDYTLVLSKSDGDMPYSFIVLDSIDADTVEASKRTTLPGAVKDACSAMHIRFGEHL